MDNNDRKWKELYEELERPEVDKLSKNDTRLCHSYAEDIPEGIHKISHVLKDGDHYYVRLQGSRKVYRCYSKDYIYNWLEEWKNMINIKTITFEVRNEIVKKKRFTCIDPKLHYIGTNEWNL